jgi:pimeloyl-ACP methyl ester carboxylesterase
VKLLGGRIHAQSWGEPDAPLVLCWHGAGDSSDDYAEIAPALAARFGVRVVAIDGPGHARSATPAAEVFRPSALAGLAADVLDELDAPTAVFVGFSWGATVGCYLAALHPGRIRALVLVEGGHFDFADIPDFPVNQRLEAFVADAMVAAEREGDAFGSHTPAVAGAMIHGLVHEPATATYERIAAAGIPLLFIGANSPGAARGVERLARLIPQAEIVELASSSHALLRDAPDEIVEAVGSRLARG